MKIFKKALSAVLALVMTPIVAFADDTVCRIYDFDKEAINSLPSYIVAEGSANTRIMYKSGNNAVYAETNNLGNDFTFTEKSLAGKKTAYLGWDCGYENAVADTSVYVVSSTGSATELIKIKSSGIYTHDNKFIDYVGTAMFKNITVKLDFTRKVYSVYSDKKLILDSWYASGITDAVSLRLSYSKTQLEGGSAVYIDNVMLSDNAGCMTKISKTIRALSDNNVPPTGGNVRPSNDFISTDESVQQQRVFVNENYNDRENMIFEYNAKRNKIEWVEENGNGYITIEKTTPDDAYIDVATSAEGDDLIISADFRFKQFGTYCPLFYFRDTTGDETVNVGPVALQIGGAITSNAMPVSNPMLNTWMNIAVHVNTRTQLADIYVNGDLKLEGSKCEIKALSMYRLYIGGGEGTVAMDFDNLKIYQGEAPRDIDNEEVQEISIYSDTAALNFLRGKKAICGTASTYWDGRKKYDMETAAIVEGDEMFVTPETLAKVFEVTVLYEDDSVTVGTAQFKKDDTNIYVGRKTVDTGIKPKLVNGTWYIPATVYAESTVKDKDVVNDEHGMLIVGDGLDSVSGMEEANKYMFFERKTADELKKEFMANTDNGAKHPRLYMDDDEFAIFKQKVETDPYMEKWLEEMRHTADKSIDAPVLEWKLENGTLNADASGYVNACAMMYRLYGEEKYLNSAIRHMDAVAGFKNWFPNHALDTSEGAMTLALGYDWLYHDLTEEQRTRYAEAGFKNGIEPIRKAYYGTANYGTWWTQTNTNWAMVVNGGLSMLIMAMAEHNPDLAFDTMAQALRAMENMWYDYGPDGAWHEGISYWNYMHLHTVQFQEAYKSIFGEMFGTNYAGYNNMAYYPTFLSDPLGFGNYYGDGEPTGTMFNAFQFQVARETGDTAFMQYSAEYMDTHKVSGGLNALLTYEPSMNLGSATLDMPLTAHMRGAEAMSMRSSYGDKNASWVSTHGGTANGPHDHLDVGSFIFTAGGVRWSEDLGTEPLSYTQNNPAIVAGYPVTYYYRRKAEGHNMVVINPDKDLEIECNGTNYAEISEPYESETGNLISSIDLSDHYNKKANSFKRGYMLTDSKTSLVVRDEIDLKEQSDVYWFMQTKASVNVIDNSTAILTLGGKQLKMKFITNGDNQELYGEEAKILPTSLDFSDTPNEDITRLAFKTNARGKLNITVKFTVLGGNNAGETPADINISEWGTVAGGSALTISDSDAQLSDIKVNGKSIFGFKSDVYNYENYQNSDGTVPELTFEANGNRTEVEEYKTYDGAINRIIKVFDATGNYSTYLVSFIAPDPVIFSKYSRLDVVGHDVSSIQQEENPPEGSYDNNFDTRFSAEGIGEWLVHDLGEVKEIDAVAVALWMGHQRNFTFDILVSDDGVTWTEVISHISSGESEGLELVEFPERVRGRYVKYLGKGNSVNKWNNIIELATLVKK